VPDRFLANADGAGRFRVFVGEEKLSNGSEDAEMTARSRCRKCGGPVSPRKGAGRPATYCSPGCRRASEYEIRRANAAVDVAERAISLHREHLALDPTYGLGCCAFERRAAHLVWWEEERQRLERRMRELLNEAGDAS
jgi:hypothetical protein